MVFYALSVFEPTIQSADGEPKLSYQGYDDIREVDARWGGMISDGL